MSFSLCFFFSSRRRHTRCSRDWSSDVCSSDLRAVVGLGVHVGHPRALVRDRGARRELGARPLVDPVQPPPVQHRGGGGVRGRGDDPGGEAAPGDVAALRAGERRRGPEVHPVEGRVRGDRIMAYSEKVVDHYNNPRNVGSFPKDTPGVGTGLVGAPECGDVMKLQIKVDLQTGVIEDAKFKTFGCGSAIASSSLATEWLKGKTVDEAAKIKNTDIVNELKLPPVKIHCSVLAEDAIKAALADCKEKWLKAGAPAASTTRSEEHTSELQSRLHLVCRLLLEKKKKKQYPKKEQKNLTSSNDY